MKSLESFDRWKCTPVDGFDMPDGNGTQKTGKTISKQSNRYHSQNDSRGRQWQVVEEILCGKHGNRSGTVGGGCGSDGAYRVLFQTPGPIVEKGHDLDPSRSFALTAFRPPSSLQFITTGKKVGP